eukprot:gnl/TRDRNA2_/TRDRNA2_127185_c0_seq1.p1 gnl/TRDRNA2_/TRDRNA2_127185_c0~~gnl/TRDRNA2_/TRDRNA2_127185_c0_seq1.p1  ORF type:complete len:307 (-),score=62.75 gnl/TRDRNA2_/TRDRNA2_127185_c0_seq1:45-965(-)
MPLLATIQRVWENCADVKLTLANVDYKERAWGSETPNPKVSKNTDDYSKEKAKAKKASGPGCVKDAPTCDNPEPVYGCKACDATEADYKCNECCPGYSMVGSLEVDGKQYCQAKSTGDKKMQGKEEMKKSTGTKDMKSRYPDQAMCGKEEDPVGPLPQSAVTGESECSSGKIECWEKISMKEFYTKLAALNTESRAVVATAVQNGYDVYDLGSWFSSKHPGGNKMAVLEKTYYLIDPVLSRHHGVSSKIARLKRAGGTLIATTVFNESKASDSDTATSTAAALPGTKLSLLALSGCLSVMLRFVLS